MNTANKAQPLAGTHHGTAPVCDHLTYFLLGEKGSSGKTVVAELIALLNDQFVAQAGGSEMSVVTVDDQPRLQHVLKDRVAFTLPLTPPENLSDDDEEDLRTYYEQVFEYQQARDCLIDTGSNSSKRVFAWFKGARGAYPRMTKEESVHQRFVAVIDNDAEAANGAADMLANAYRLWSKLGNADFFLVRNGHKGRFKGLETSCEKYKLMLELPWLKIVDLPRNKSVFWDLWRNKGERSILDMFAALDGADEDKKRREALAAETGLNTGKVNHGIYDYMLWLHESQKALLPLLRPEVAQAIKARLDEDADLYAVA
ncbi:hypothetical protein [Azospirillum rugosum]|uniref:hypothetical protein n=1 Tax=Azospirillum rugosum TaxID=416170 RepID=UPI0036125BB8